MMINIDFLTVSWLPLFATASSVQNTFSTTVTHLPATNHNGLMSSILLIMLVEKSLPMSRFASQRKDGEK